MLLVTREEMRDQRIASSESMGMSFEFFSSGRSSDDEVTVPVPGVPHDHHHHGGHHSHHHRDEHCHHHDHGHGRHHHHHGHHGIHIVECSLIGNVPGELPVSVILEEVPGPRDENDHQRHRHRQQRPRMNHHMCVYSRRDERNCFKLLRRKNSEFRRAHRSRHFKKEKLCRALVRLCESRDQRGLSNSGVSAVGEKHGFPGHLLEDWHDMDCDEAKLMGSTFMEVDPREVREVRERGWSSSVGVAERVVETLGGSSQRHQFRSRRPGHKRNHRSKHHRRYHQRHHRECRHQRHRMSGGSVDVYLQPVQGTLAPTRVDVGIQAPAAPATARDEAGPSATYEEKIAEGLIPAPEDSS